MDFTNFVRVVDQWRRRVGKIQQLLNAFLYFLRVFAQQVFRFNLCYKWGCERACVELLNVQLQVGHGDLCQLEFDDLKPVLVILVEFSTLGDIDKLIKIIEFGLIISSVHLILWKVSIRHLHALRRLLDNPKPLWLREKWLAGLAGALARLAWLLSGLAGLVKVLIIHLVQLSEVIIGNTANTHLNKNKIY